jgi:hypothetical protein
LKTFFQCFESLKAYAMKLKISQNFLLLIVLIESASLSSADKMMLNVITETAEHQSLSQAVTEIIGSLDIGDITSATKLNVIKVTSHEVDAKKIDLFTDTIVRSINGLFEIHVREYDESKDFKRTRHDALLIVSRTMTIREMEKFLLPFSFASHKKLLIVLLDKTASPSAAANNIKLMLDIMWRKFILNVHVVTPEGNGDVSLNTYFPFTKDFCGQVHPEVWNIYRNGAFLMEREHFPRKNNNFFQCALTVAVYNAVPYLIVLNRSGSIDVDGVDGNLLKQLSKELNFTINYVVVSDDVRWGEIHANRSATGTMELVSL